MATASRTVPIAVRRELRQEVGFACPVSDCGSPYLTWHHFDPPWRLAQHHEPGGMIALCLEHHKRADAGAFTAEQLREMKSRGDSAGTTPIRGAFDWRRKQLIVRAGGITGIGCPVLLRFGTTNAIWLSTDDQGNELLNLDLWAADGTLVFSMRDNDWVVIPDLDDIDCPPAGKSLILHAAPLGIHLEIRFTGATIDEARERFRQSALLAAIEAAKRREDFARQAEASGAPAAFVETVRQGSDPEEEAKRQAEMLIAAIGERTDAKEVALCDLSGEFVFPAAVRLTRNSLILPGNNVISGSSVIGSGVAVQLR
jgi:hypothetical protein